jgi:hypothetical protein
MLVLKKKFRRGADTPRLSDIDYAHSAILPYIGLFAASLFIFGFLDWANLHTNQPHLNLDVFPPAYRRSTGISYSAFAAEI